MPSSDDRFYLLEFKNRPVKYGDIGSLLRIEGLVVGGGGAKAILMLPGMKCLLDPEARLPLATEYELTVEDWSDFIHRSDNPEILVGPKPDGMGATLPKIFQRKVRYEISGAVQQKVWATDGFRCMYCGAEMGKVLMTVDHFIPLELGGKNDTSNYIAACKPCNKKKGSSHPVEFLRTHLAAKSDPGFPQARFDILMDYLKRREYKFGGVAEGR